MRDGVTLATDVYRPGAEGRYPTLLQRIPYGKEPAWLRDASVDVMRIVQAGYAVVHQDTRGAGASEGVYRPFVDDRQDGVDAIAWAAAQPWSTSKVGMIGISYTAGTQWLAAIEAPAELKAFAPHSFHGDPYGGWLYQGGAFSLGLAIRWSLNYFSPSVKDNAEYIGSVDRYKELVWRLPISDMPLLEPVAPFYFEWLSHPVYDAYWRPWSPLANIDKVVAPALMTTGWYDALLGGALGAYRAFRARNAVGSRLIIGPWSHTWWGADFPQHSYGEKADKDVYDLTRATVRWFDHHLKGAENGVDSDRPVHVFVMGPNVWREEDDWPLPDTRFTRYYLHSNGRANTAFGDGTLTTAPADAEAEDVFLYNPRDPVPTVGGQTLLPPARIPITQGPQDQQMLNHRADVLCFTTAPLERGLEVIGPVELVLFVSSTARDTDFTGKLIDLYPDGRAEILTDGILRVRYRNSLEAPELMEPGQIYDIRIDMLATGLVFAAGHRIRLDVSSSNFPRFDRNTNTGGTIAEDREEDVTVAVNRVHHDREHQSHLVLPVIART
jgi:hypothetical protein